MTRKEACKILGITQNAEETEIKNVTASLCAGSTRTRRRFPKFFHEIQQIILAYQVLKEEKFFSTENASPDGSSRKASVSWDAPLNVHAYREREILHSAEDSTEGLREISALPRKIFLENRRRFSSVSFKCISVQQGSPG